MKDNDFPAKVERFWSHDASNIRCVREADFDRVTAERDALQQRLTAADERADHWRDIASEATCRAAGLNERADVMEGLLRTSLLAMKRIYQAGYDRIIESGGTCDTPEYMMEHDPTARDIQAALKPAECCTVSAEEQALLDAGDYTPEELFGVGGKPSCPKCAQ